MINLAVINALIIIGWGIIGIVALIVAQHEMDGRQK